VQPQLPATHRRVTLNIDGIQHDVTVDVRESIWETMTQKLGLANWAVTEPSAARAQSSSTVAPSTAAPCCRLDSAAARRS
jgi:hypothetical protein